MDWTAIRLSRLKSDWACDPHWDIEKTEGFEAYHDHLLAFRKQKEAEWEAALEQRLRLKSAQLGVPGNLALAAYVERLEQRIEELEQSVWRLHNRNP